jgi:pectate lyase
VSDIIDEIEGRMKKIVTIVIYFLTMILLNGCVDSVPIESVTPDETTPELPIETDIHHAILENPFGFSSLVITDRSQQKTGIAIVSSALEFIQALNNSEVKVIEVTHDLNLGSKAVESELMKTGLSIDVYRAVYRAHNHQALLHPTLIEQGVGSIRIIGRDGLMIYSKTGNIIKHASFLIDNSSDIVIRNLYLSELWEWDEEDRGQFKRNDWDYISIEDSNGIWLDHLTFDQAYDGIVDVKAFSSNITLSWSKLNFRNNPFVTLQIEALEENREIYPYYDELRTSGMTKEDIITLASFQKKGFNLGNTTDGEGFESITMTFHHLEVFNLMDRMPRIRKGDAHLYHIILDNSDIHELRLKYPNLSMVNQGIISTEGGNVLMEHSIYKYVSTPIKNHQDSDPNPKYTGSYQVINSEMMLPTRDYFGSSTDQNSLWFHSNSHPSMPFAWRNHEKLPYSYTLIDIYFLPERFQAYPTGHQTIPSFDWTYIQ